MTTEITTAVTADNPVAPAPLSLALILACEVAAGVTEADETAIARTCTAAAGSWNSRGTKGNTYYRMVWRSGAWAYFASGRLVKNKWNGKMEGKARGDVYAGELLCEHDHGAKVDSVYLVSDEPDGADPWSLHRLDFKRTRAGLLVTLPTGAHVTLPDPRT